MNTVLLSLKNNISSLLVAFLMLCSVGSWGQISEGFSTGLRTSGYAGNGTNTGNLTLSSGVWVFVNSGLANTNAANYNTSSPGCQMQSGTGNSATLPPLNTCGTISFWFKGGTPTLSKTIGGSTTSITLIKSGNNYSATINDASSSIIFKISNSASTSYLDDVVTTTFAATPCSGTPSPGNTISSETSVVSGGTTNLSLQNTTTGSGVTYQWQSSTTSASTGFANISGATSATYTATVTAKTWYKCVVTCSGNDGTSTVAVVDVVSGPCFSKDFESGNISEWTSSGGITGGGSTTVNGSSGDYYLNLNENGEYAQLPISNTYSSITFNLQGSASFTNSWTLYVQYSADGAIWNNISGVGTIAGTTIGNSSYSLQTVNIPISTSYVRLFLDRTGNSCYIGDLSAFCGPATPIITVSGALTGLDYIVGSGPSAPKSFTIEGSALTTDITVTAPTNFEIATTAGGTYGNSLTLSQSSGTVASTTLYTRLKAGLAIATYTGSITATSTGAPDKTIALTGIVSPIPPVLITSALTKSTVYGTADTYVITASGSPTSFGTGALPTGFSFTGATLSKATTVDAGIYNISISATNAGGTDTKTLVWTVTPKQLTITGLTGTNKVYNGNASAILSGTAALSGILFSDDVTLSGASTSNFANKNVGTVKPITTTGYSLSGAKAANYSLTQPALTANITAKVLTITGATAQNKAYDGTTAATISGATLGGVIALDDVTVSGGGTFDNANVGTAKVVTATLTLAGADSGNYTVTQPTGLTANITAIAPTFTTSAINLNIASTYALAGTNIASTSMGAFSYSITGGGNATLSGTTLTGVAIGTETLTVNQAADGNYLAGSTTVSVVVSLISYTTNDYRTATGGTWSTQNTGTSTWEKWNGSTWATSSKPSASTSNVYIRHTITSNGNSTVASIIVESPNILELTPGGNYTLGHASTINTKLLIQNGGVFEATAALTNNGILEVEDNGTFNINYATASGTAAIWNGIENFHSGSIFNIKNWNYGASAGIKTLIQNPSIINLNSDGYYFGNLIISGNLTGTLPMVSGNQTINLCKNDFTRSAIGSNVFFTSSAGNITVGGNVIVNSGQISFAAVSSAVTTNIYILGNLIANGGNINLNQNSSGSLLNLNLFGDLFIGNTNTISSINDNSSFNFTGTGDGLSAATTQTIDIVNQTTATNISFNVKSGAYAQLINQNFALGTNSKLTVEDGGTFDFGFNAATALNVTGAAFDSKTGSTLKITSPNGITSSGTGNVQTTTRNYAILSPYANYHYIGKANQVTGNGLPLTINTLTINNSGATGSNTVTLDAARGIASATNSLRLQAGLLNLNTKQLDIPDLGTVASTGGDFTGTAGPLNFVGSGSSTGVLNFPTVTINGGVNFNTGANIVTSLQLNANSFVNPNAPTYGSSSTLIYNTGGPYGRNVEFGALSGAGYPNHVLIQNGTTLDLSANSPADLAIAGNLTLGNLTATGSLSMGSMGNKFTVGGNVSIGANTSGGTSTLSLSSVNAGDIHVKGNWTKSSNGDFIPNNRAVFFAGASPQTLTGATTFDYLRMLQTANSTLTLINNINIAKDIVFGTGKIVTGLNTVVMNTTATTSSGENPNSYIHGKQQWDFYSPSARFYSIGDATVYAGVNIAYTTVTTGGALNISTAAGDQANIGTSVFDANQTVNRNYTLTTPNTLAGTYSATFGFDAGDKDAGIDTAKLSVGNYVGGAWNYPAVGARTATSTQGTGITTFGDFQLASKGDCSSIKTWNGSVWIGGTPTMDDAVIFNGDYDTTTLPNVESCECMINAGKTVTVTLDKTLKVNAGLTVSDNGTPLNFDDDGKLLIKDGGSLVQVKDVVNATANNNVGSINMERITKPVFRYDFTYWSSPVQNFKLKSVSPTTLFNKFFHWNETATPQAWELHNVTNAPDYLMEVGRGYIVRAPQDYVVETATGIGAAPYTANFIGKPNNGIVTMSVAGSTTVNKWNLLGNPYPSAIDAQTFLTANSNLGGTLYFWTHNTSVSASSPNYAPSDYASWNGTGSVATSSNNDTDEIGDGELNTNAPNGKIAAGQSFFVKGILDGVGSVTFNNATRISGQNNQFFKTTPTDSEDNTTGKHRVWLNLKGQVKGFNQILVGYIENATNAYDNRFDGESFGGNFVTFYSVLDTKNLVIQGRALPFSDEDTVPLGYKTTLTGNLIISIDHVDGLMEDQDIYLQDNSLNVVHNLKDSDYTFASIPGTFNSRFVLRYVPQVDLSNPTFDEQVKGVRIYKNQANLYVNSPYETIATVAVYDITGRKLYEQKDCNTNRFETNHISTTDQALIVKVTLKNGAVVTEKVL